MLPQGGQEIACKPLLDCLCVAMTCHQGAAVAPSTLVPMPLPFPIRIFNSSSLHIKFRSCIPTFLSYKMVPNIRALCLLRKASAPVDR